MPPAVGFVFDRECRREEELQDLGRYEGRSVKFIPRRMYENYLLKPAAIAAVIGSLEGFVQSLVSEDVIRVWLDEQKMKPEFYCPKLAEREPWVKYVHGAEILSRLFACFSDQTVPYSKVIHGVQITRWILTNEPDELIEILTPIHELLDVRFGRDV